jgi:TRAP-type uncharacterized transport system fused permease subunit
MMVLVFTLPIVVIVGTLLTGRSAALGGFYATLAALGLSFIADPKLLRRTDWLVGICRGAGRGAATILVAVAAVGIVIGVMNMTGLGLRFANVILLIAGDSLFGGLLIMMAGCLVLGMGMPTVPAYLVIVLVIGPAIAKLGVPILLVHLFAVYFGVLSSITPPVALAAYAAAPIAGAQPLRTAMTGVRVAMVGFIVPFVLIYNPALSLVEGFEPMTFLWVCFRLGLAIWLLTTALAGHGWRTPLQFWDRALRVLFAVAALTTDPSIQVIGSLGGAAVIVLNRFPQMKRLGGRA